jgi:hypothetical protein
MMSRKQWFEVLIVTEKTVRIFAEDEDDAKEKASHKYEPLWTVENAWPQSRGE